MLTRLRTAALIVSVTVVTGDTDQSSPVNRPWPPGVQNGKDGPIGLMPPVGSVLSDDQIAAVLTYIRREWGQTATAVDPAEVKTLRAQTATRTRPWTHDELLAMVKGGQ